MFNPEPFYNREAERQALERAWAHPAKGGQMAMIYRRRRLGKTYLLQRFVTAGDSKPACHCTGRNAGGFTEPLLALAQEQPHTPRLIGPEHLL